MWSALLRRAVLLPYSPDLNPIEKLFVKLIDCFPSRPCANSLRNAGFAST